MLKYATFVSNKTKLFAFVFTFNEANLQNVSLVVFLKHFLRLFNRKKEQKSSFFEAQEAPY